MNSDGTGITEIFTSSGASLGGPTWARDGSRIAFTRRVEDNSEIFSINPDGTGLVRLTYSPADEYNVAWGPYLTPRREGEDAEDLGLLAETALLPPGH